MKYAKCDRFYTNIKKWEIFIESLDYKKLAFKNLLHIIPRIRVYKHIHAI